MPILAGDIGGTKTLLQIADANAQNDPYHTLRVLFERRYCSVEFSTFDALLHDFLTAARQAEVPMPTAACIGVAGPVTVDESGRTIAKVTNLPWVFDEETLSTQFKLHPLRLLNDFQAIGYGLDVLGDEDLVALRIGEAAAGPLPFPRVLIGAGTGLGQGILVWQGDVSSGYYEVYASEGGHADFAPASREQRELLSFLAEQQTRVSVEDVLSGPGLVNAYQFFADKYPQQANPAFQQIMEEGDAAAVVSDAALSARDPLAERALALFIEIYGGQAGNLALTCMAMGGVFIAGGIAPKIQSWMMNGRFLAAFQNKGSMSGLMRKMPVMLVTDPQVGLKGAARVASRL